jgi:hypothetical protein
MMRTTWIGVVGAPLVVSDCALAVHGNDPVPAIAFGVLALGGARDCRHCGGRGADAPQTSTGDVVRCLDAAPLNVASIAVPDALLLAAVIDTLRVNPRHFQLTGLHAAGQVLSLEEATTLLAVTGGLRSLRRLTAVGPGALHLLRRAPAVREACVSFHDGDLSGCGALRVIGDASFSPGAPIWRAAAAAAYCRGVTFPPGLTTIQQSVFAKNGWVTAIDLSATRVTRIGASFAMLCAVLRRVAFPPTLERLGANSLTRCAALQRLDLSGTRLRSIPPGLAAFCRALTVLLLPPALVIVHGGAFNMCGSLTLGNLPPPTLRAVSPGAFAGCPCQSTFAPYVMARPPKMDTTDL